MSWNVKWQQVSERWKDGWMVGRHEEEEEEEVKKRTCRLSHA